jgi:hypothetical protein
MTRQLSLERAIAHVLQGDAVTTPTVRKTVSYGIRDLVRSRWLLAYAGFSSRHVGSPSIQ